MPPVSPLQLVADRVLCVYIKYVLTLCNGKIKRWPDASEGATYQAPPNLFQPRGPPPLLYNSPNFPPFLHYYNVSRDFYCNFLRLYKHTLRRKTPSREEILPSQVRRTQQPTRLACSGPDVQGLESILSVDSLSTIKENISLLFMALYFLSGLNNFTY